MLELNGFASTANLIADPTRAAMLAALMDGRAVSAGELACASGITAQTASSHLAKLLEGGILKVEQQGRHRYYRLAGAQVAEAMELLATIQPRQSLRQRRLSPEGQRLRFCRCCYNHLAGQVGVAVTEALVAKGYLKTTDDKAFIVTSDGAEWFGELGIDMKELKAARNGVARQCLDWTERTHHLAGPLGVELFEQMVARGWVRRGKASRSLTVSPEGWVELYSRLGVKEPTVLS